MVSSFNPNLISKRARPYFESNRKVLVIEDDRIMGQMVSEILSDVGFEVTTAATGMLALEKLKQQPIDFIILDILLPEMDGFEVYQKLQADPQTKDIPVMIVTAWADRKHLDKASQMGIKQFLAKPFTEDELLLAILTLLIDSTHGEAPQQSY
ncbi:MAG: response regulator [Anaerolineae bacterium]|nr:response regulator [Anaerolineae bacterium]